MLHTILKYTNYDYTTLVSHKKEVLVAGFVLCLILFSLFLDLAIEMSLLPFFVLGSEGGSAGGNSGATASFDNNGNLSNVGLSTTPSGFNSIAGSSFSEATIGDTSWSGSIDGVGYDISVGNTSTPFLTVHNGKEFVHENDFLFGKPNTAFHNYKIGFKAYIKGIGGDTYLLSPALKSDVDGTLKMKIRELEPEESFIDTFQLNALDLKKNEHFVVDGNLKDSYIFNEKEVKMIHGQTIHMHHSKQGVFTAFENTYTSLASKEGVTGSILHPDDELIIKLPKASLSTDTDTFILVDSHFRDWSLGNSVPFSHMERFTIGSLALGKTTVTTMAGIVILATAAMTGVMNSDTDLLKKIMSVPYTYAEAPVPRSLVVAVQDGNIHTYLQTLFPRYVQSSQEVVRIPKEIIKNLKDSFLSVRIKATKKHKVLSAFVFAGKAEIPALTPLVMTGAVHRSDNVDYKEHLTEKNNFFLKTIPGDVVDITVQDIPKIPQETRRYILTASGFYTNMSAYTQAKLGKNWIDKLSKEDRSLLKNLRLT